MAYNGRLAIIAGGLGGIATATGRLLVNHGARLALLHAPFETEKASSIVSSSYESRHLDQITTISCDITKPEDVNKAFRQIEDYKAPVLQNVLINAAGYVSLSKMEDTTPEETRKNIDINLLGTVFTSQAFARMYLRLKERHGDRSGGMPGGRIVNLSSQAGHVALPLHGAYCASKAGLMGLTRSMALEWGPLGITSNTVSPTVVWTTLGKKAWADITVREAFQAKIPTGRFAEPEEVASSIEFLCRDDSGMINGADIRVDGGFTIT